MSDNFLEMTFQKPSFEQLFKDIKTELSQKCWMQTQDLITEISLNAFKHGKASSVILHISSDRILLKDDGIAFNTKELINKTDRFSGGNWTITQYINDYPEINISYDNVLDKNETVIQFPDRMFNVNGLCEIILQKNTVFTNIDISLKHPNIKARYYYLDFSGFNEQGSFLCMSGVGMLLGKLSEFCASQGSEVYIHLPNENVVWADFEEKINIYNERWRHLDKIHIIRE